VRLLSSFFSEAAIMWHKELIPDKAINLKVTQQLSARGMRSPCKIAVQTAKGVVTLSGDIEYEHQRNAAIQAARHLDGVNSVVDQLHVKAKTSPQKQVFIPEVSPPPTNRPSVAGKEPGAKASPQRPEPSCQQPSG
jgi:hypothetical protein